MRQRLTAQPWAGPAAPLGQVWAPCLFCVCPRLRPHHEGQETGFWRGNRHHREDGDLSGFKPRRRGPGEPGASHGEKEPSSTGKAAWAGLRARGLHPALLRIVSCPCELVGFGQAPLPHPASVSPCVSGMISLMIQGVVPLTWYRLRERALHGVCAAYEPWRECAMSPLQGGGGVGGGVGRRG